METDDERPRSNPTMSSAATIEQVIMTTQYGDRVLRDRYCEDCQPAIKGTTKRIPWHDPDPECKNGRKAHCACATCF